jgi:hypothetical protein
MVETNAMELDVPKEELAVQVEEGPAMRRKRMLAPSGLSWPKSQVRWRMKQLSHSFSQ